MMMRRKKGGGEVVSYWFLQISFIEKEEKVAVPMTMLLLLGPYQSNQKFILMKLFVSKDLQHTVVKLQNKPFPNQNVINKTIEKLLPFCK